MMRMKRRDLLPVFVLALVLGALLTGCGEDATTDNAAAFPMLEAPKLPAPETLFKPPQGPSQQVEDNVPPKGDAS